MKPSQLITLVRRRESLVEQIHGGPVLDMNPLHEHVSLSGGTTITGLENAQGPVAFGTVLGSLQWAAVDSVFNGHPSVTIAAGATDAMLCSGYDGSADGWAQFWVTKDDSPDATDRYSLCDTTNGATTQRYIVAPSFDLSGPKSIINAGGSGYFTLENDNVVKQQVTVYGFRALKSGGDVVFSIWRNGRKLYQTTVTMTWSPWGCTGSSKLIDAGTGTGTQRVARGLVYDAVFSDTDMTQVMSHLMVKYGARASFKDIASLHEYWLSNQGVTTSTDGVTLWEGALGNNSLSASGTAGKYPQLVGSRLTFDGVDDYLKYDSDVSASLTDFSAFFGANLKRTATNSEAIWDTGNLVTSRVILFQNTGNAGDALGWWQTNQRDHDASPTIGDQALGWCFENGVACRMYRDQDLLAQLSAATYAQTDILAGAILPSSGLGQTPTEMDLWTHAIYLRALSEEEAKAVTLLSQGLRERHSL